ncbi:MAG: glycoside hydrolase family protein [Thainema sp.]
MSRTLELYPDGQLCEYQADQPIKATDTQNQVDLIIEALQFSTATTLTTAPPGKLPPDIPTPRGSERPINTEGFKLLTTFEGCKLKAYDDGGGVWTIGYGHTQGVFCGMTITQAQANQFLREDLEKFETFVQDAVAVEVNDDQFSALVCLCFNIGPGRKGFRGSTLLRLLNQGNYLGAAKQFPRWNKVSGTPWLGLTRRRLAEQALFNSQPWEPFLTYNGPVEVFDEITACRVLKLTRPLMQGEDVRHLQQALLNRGFDLGPDGADSFFGSATEKAVRQLQTQEQLTVDGIVGSQTWQALGL